MKYRYEDLSDSQFEVLVILICQHLLGISVQGFSEGPDGGRDAKFIGKAELHPSSASPWEGITIIQAKHTIGYNKTFADSDFYSKNSQNTILGKEIPRIKSLIANGQLNNYMLFSNRRLSGGMENIIRETISVSCGLDQESIFICGFEQIELFLKIFPDVVENSEIDLVDCPLIVSPEDLSDVVHALANQFDTLRPAEDIIPTPRFPYDKKNTKNGLSEPYAKEFLQKYLPDTRQVQSFLASPENFELLQLYESIVNEFQFKILSKRKDYQSFDEVLERLVRVLFERDVILRSKKKLTRLMIFYMYWNCDIGEVDNA